MNPVFFMTLVSHILKWYHGISDCTISFVIRSLQVGGGIKTLIAKEISRSNIVPYWFPRVYSLDGLICLRGGHDFHVFNPTTGEFVSLLLCIYGLLV